MPVRSMIDLPLAAAFCQLTYAEYPCSALQGLALPIVEAIEAGDRSRAHRACDAFLDQTLPWQRFGPETMLLVALHQRGVEALHTTEAAAALEAIGHLRALARYLRYA